MTSSIFVTSASSISSSCSVSSSSDMSPSSFGCPSVPPTPAPFAAAFAAALEAFDGLRCESFFDGRLSVLAFFAAGAAAAPAAAAAAAALPAGAAALATSLCGRFFGLAASFSAGGGIMLSSGLIFGEFGLKLFATMTWAACCPTPSGTSFFGGPVFRLDRSREVRGGPVVGDGSPARSPAGGDEAGTAAALGVKLKTVRFGCAAAPASASRCRSSGGGRAPPGRSLCEPLSMASTDLLLAVSAVAEAEGCDDATGAAAAAAAAATAGGTAGGGGFGFRTSRGVSPPGDGGVESAAFGASTESVALASRDSSMSPTILGNYDGQRAGGHPAGSNRLMGYSAGIAGIAGRVAPSLCASAVSVRIELREGFLSKLGCGRRGAWQGAAGRICYYKTKY